MSGDLRARAMRLELAELVQIDNQARVEMTVRCRDCEAIPKVPEAGHVLMENDTRVQVMHNGLRVVADGYYGAWTTETSSAAEAITSRRRRPSSTPCFNIFRRPQP